MENRFLNRRVEAGRKVDLLEALDAARDLIIEVLPASTARRKALKDLDRATSQVRKELNKETPNPAA